MEIQGSAIRQTGFQYFWGDPEDGNRYSGPLSILKDRIDIGMQVIPQFALYGNTYLVAAEGAHVVDVLKVISIIKGNSLKSICDQIKAARLSRNDILKVKLKATLPYFTHSGIFIPRRNENLILPSFTFQLDIDKLPDPLKILSQIIKDKQLDILFASVSPSGNGVKGLLFLKELMYLRESWDWQQYKTTYYQVTKILSEHFRSDHGVVIDEQMKAISQPFYLFHAPDLYVHPNLLPWI
jgi:hypothetical protein